MKILTASGNALITGGCSGIGYAIARELAARGFNLILVSNQETRLKGVCKELTDRYKIKAWPVVMDLAKTDAAQTLYYWCLNEQLSVDILVNNAGFFFFKEVAKTEPDKAQQMLLLHNHTPVLLCTLFGMEMKLRGKGHILNISSLGAYMPYPGIALYSSTKRFLKSFSRALRTEMIDYGVNVTCICPGAVSTQLYQLSEPDQRIALRSGIMMKPEKLAHKAVNAMFRRRSWLIPGVFNRISLLFILLIPHGILLLIRRHSKFLPPDNTIGNKNSSL